MPVLAELGDEDDELETETFELETETFDDETETFDDETLEDDTETFDDENALDTELVTLLVETDALFDDETLPETCDVDPAPPPPPAPPPSTMMVLPQPKKTPVQRPPNASTRSLPCFMAPDDTSGRQTQVGFACPWRAAGADEHVSARASQPAAMRFDASTVVPRSIVISPALSIVME